MTKPLIMIANPCAGRGKLKRLADEITQWFKRHDRTVECHWTEGPRHAIELTQSFIEKGHDTILSLGGDGTSFEVMNGIMMSGQSEHVSYAVLPAGTGNDFLRSFGVKDWQSAAQAVFQGKKRSIDVGRIERHDGSSPLFFHNVVMFGMGAQACYLRHHRYHFLGSYAYHVAILNLMFSIESHRVTLKKNGVESSIETPVMAICNTKYTGHGMNLSPQSEPDDAQLEMISVEPVSSLRLLRLFMAMLKGNHLNHASVHHEQLKAVEFDVEGIDYFMVDGEIMDYSPMTIDLPSEKLTMLLP